MHKKVPLYLDQLKFWNSQAHTEAISFLDKEEKEGRPFVPHRFDIYRALTSITNFADVRVLILGQDPYPQPGIADGLAFSTRHMDITPPTLENIFTELVDDVGTRYPQTNNLTQWAWHGVMLLNSSLTRQGVHGPHKGIWEPLIKEVCEVLATNDKLAVVLWGNQAKKYAKYFDPKRHLIHTGVHPSPLSAHLGFFGSKPFSKVNTYLEGVGLKPIYWEL